MNTAKGPNGEIYSLFRDAKSGQKRRMRPGSKAAIDTTGDLRALDAKIRKIREAVQP